MLGLYIKQLKNNPVLQQHAMFWNTWEILIRPLTYNIYKTLENRKNKENFDFTDIYILNDSEHENNYVGRKYWIWIQQKHNCEDYLLHQQQAAEPWGPAEQFEYHWYKW